MSKGNGKANGKRSNQEIGTLPAVQTDKQRRFVEEYCVDFNATQAAIRAGYSAASARSTGPETLSNPVIRLAIEERLAQLTMSSAEAAVRLTDWGRGSLDPFLTDSGHINLSSETAKANRHLLKKVKCSHNQYGETVEIEIHDSKDAVIQMAKLHGMFNDTGGDSGEVLTPERVAGLFEQLQRIKTVGQLEKLLTGIAAKQLGGA